MILKSRLVDHSVESTWQWFAIHEAAKSQFIFTHQHNSGALYSENDSCDKYMLHAVVSNSDISIWCNIFVTKCEQQTETMISYLHTLCVCGCMAMFCPTASCTCLT